MNLFEKLGLNEELLKVVEAAGYTSPTPIQELTIPQLLTENTDFVALAQTGTGKTAAFGLPLIQKIAENNFEGVGVILCPTRELCLQTSKEISKFALAYKNFKVATIYGGAGSYEQKLQLRKKPHLIVATPGRFIDFMNQGEVDIKKCRNLVLDEADEMLNMGFREDVEMILSEMEEPRNIWLFSATMPDTIKYLAKKYLKNPKEALAGRVNSANPNISHQFYMTPHGKDYELLRRLLDREPNAYAIIFVRTKIATRELAEKLIVDGFDADALHGDLSQQLREQVMTRFRNKSLKLLIATDVAARGIDVDNVTHVFHYYLPDDLEVYTHRSGRTARAGKQGKSVVIIHKREFGRLRMLERSLKIKFEEMKIPMAADIINHHFDAIIQDLKANALEIDDQAIPKPIFAKLAELEKEELISLINHYVFSKLVARYEDKNESWIERAQNGDDRGGREDRRDSGRGDRRDREDSFSRDRRGGSESSGSSKRFERGDDADVTYGKVQLSVGNDEGFSKASLFEFMRSRELKRINVGKIKVADSATYVEVPEQDIKTFINGMDGQSFGNTTIKAEPDNGSGSSYRGGSSDRRSGGGSDRRSGGGGSSDRRRSGGGGGYGSKTSSSAPRERSGGFGGGDRKRTPSDKSYKRK